MPNPTPIFKSPKHAEEMGNKYFEWCNSKDGEYPTIIGFATFCNAYRASIWNYSQRPEYKAVMAHIKDRIYDEKFKAGLRGDLNPTLFIFDAVNNHGMVNTRAENKNNTKISGELTLAQALEQAHDG